MKRKFEHEEQGGKGRFFYVKKEEEQGEIIYQISDNSKLTILSTEVHDDARGQGLGSDLVEKLIDYAAENDYEIESQCSFATTVIESSKRMKKEVEKSGS